MCEPFSFSRELIRLTATYSDNAGLGVTTIGPEELNCRVRNGNGCDLFGNTISLISSPLNSEKIGYKHLSVFAALRRDTIFLQSKKIGGGRTASSSNNSTRFIPSLRSVRYITDRKICSFGLTPHPCPSPARGEGKDEVSFRRVFRKPSFGFEVSKPKLCYPSSLSLRRGKNLRIRPSQTTY